MKKEVNDYLFLTLILFVFLFFFLLDYLVPGEVQLGVLYCIPVVFSSFVFERLRWTYFFIALSAIAIILSAFFLDSVQENFLISTANSMLLIVVNLLIGVIAVQLKKSIYAQSEYDKVVKAGLAIAPIGICYVEDEKVIYGNDQFYRLVESTALDNLDINKLIWNSKGVNIAFELALKKHSQKAIIQKKTYLGKTQKRIKEVELTYQEVQKGRKPIQILLFKEIGEREKILETLKLNNEKLKFVIEEANEGSWEYDYIDSRFEVSEKFWNLIGKNSQFDQDFSKSLFKEDYTLLIDELQNFSFKYQDQIFQVEVRCTSSSGEQKNLLLKGKCIKRKEDLSPERVMGIFIDITQQKQLESILEESNKSLEQFAYIASHDLKAPIRHIHNYVELLQEDLENIEDVALQKNTAKYMKVITKNTNKMKRMVEALLNYARIGYQDIDKKQINLNHIIRDNINLFQGEVQKKSASFNIEELPPIQGNLDLVNNLIQNLISNSLKFNDQSKPVEINVKFEETETNISIFFEDNGIGIPSENAKDIFTIFKRSHDIKQYEGTGIGLSIAKRIMELHNGDIKFENIKSGGARFILSFPKQKG